MSRLQSLLFCSSRLQQRIECEQSGQGASLLRLLRLKALRLRIGRRFATLLRSESARRKSLGPVTVPARSA